MHLIDNPARNAAILAGNDLGAILANPETRYEYLKQLAEEQRIRLERDSLFEPVVEMLARAIHALLELQFTLTNRPAITVKLSEITTDAEPLLKRVGRLIEDEQMNERADGPRI